MIFRRLTLRVAPSGNAAVAACGRCCPRCRSSVFGVTRRFQDLLVSVFVPSRRYRCISMQCNWEGNLREKRSVLMAQTFS